MSEKGFNPKRLRTAMKYCRRQLWTARKQRVLAIQQYVGKHYADKGAPQAVPINLIELAVNTWARYLVARNPKVLVKTKYPELMPSAATYQLAINHLIKEINLSESLYRVALDGIFSLGIGKVGICEGGKVEINGFLHDIGQPFFDAIDLDDWVHDTTANRFEQVQFAGNRYRIPYEYAMEMDIFDKKARSKLKPTPRNGQLAEGESGQKRSDQLFESTIEDDSEYMKTVELWDIWIPIENRFITIPFENIDDCVLKNVEWEGPETGPYHLLPFNYVPNNIMPLSPVGIIYDLHDFANLAYRKLSRQADREKKILTVPPEATKDGERVVSANDGDTITAQNTANIKEVKFGGVSQESFLFLMQTMKDFSRHAGNLDMIAGLSPMSETLGQDQMLMQSASRRMADMQEAMIAYTKKTIENLAWYLINDPLINLPLVKQVKGSDIKVKTVFSRETMEGDYFDYNFEIEPFSMQPASPSAKIQAINMLMQNYVLPMQPYLAQQGIGVDFEKLLRLFGEYHNITDIEDIIMFKEPMRASPVGEAPPKAAATQRTVVRVNRPGATNEGTSNILMQALAGNVNKDQAAAIGRPVG